MVRPGGEGWNERVMPTPKDRMSPHVRRDGAEAGGRDHPGGRHWRRQLRDRLEQIAKTWTNLSKSSLTPGGVLAEVTRPYEQRVMSNVHRSEYVEAIVALALRDSGWTRMEPWDAWDCEHESGARLEVKQSAAAQSWWSERSYSPPRFDIAPRTRYWDYEKDRWVFETGCHAHVYVFAWHGEPRQTADQRDPAGWEFSVVPEPDLPAQKTIGLTAIRGLTSPCEIEDLTAEVVEMLRASSVSISG